MRRNTRLTFSPYSGHMDMCSTLARVATGLAVRAGVCVGAIYGASVVWRYVSNVFGSVSNVLQ